MDSFLGKGREAVAAMPAPTAMTAALPEDDDLEQDEVVAPEADLEKEIQDAQQKLQELMARRGTKRQTPESVNAADVRVTFAEPLSGEGKKQEPPGLSQREAALPEATATPSRGGADPCQATATEGAMPDAGQRAREGAASDASALELAEIKARMETMERLMMKQMELITAQMA